MKKPSMPSGYCFELTWITPPLHDDTAVYRTPDADWDTVVYKPDGGERAVGDRKIDGCLCVVFHCPDGKYRAVNKVNVTTGGKK